MKKIILALTLALFGFLTWYFLIKSSDYNIYFNTSASQGHAYSELANWAQLTEVAEASSAKRTDPYSKMLQKLRTGTGAYQIAWELTSENDSVTRIKAGITQPAASWKNRLMAPFSDTEFEQNTLDIVLDYKNFLEESLGQFKIAIEGVEDSPEKFCVCTSASSKPEEKAFRMMRDYSYLSDYLLSNKLQPDGKPLVRIRSFEEEENRIAFDFCFPLIKTDSMPALPDDMFFLELKREKALKAIYNGDYRFSNKSWYKMYDRAASEGLKVKRTPVEIYHNNPNMGGDASRWVTEIYLPVE